MSTFQGVVAEFPRIRIDYFRPVPGQLPPLACFLSHVHSDHLQGLESLKAPFVYCSPATREIVLRLEKYPHRMNFAKGILESRVQTYKHLKYLLKTLPLETPTVIELSPGNELRVTLFDANHCAGAVMFLIQGDGKAILYTGDIRSESWWVNSLVQNPVLIPYTLGSRWLDCMYLDTTFATKALWSRDFPSKAEGINELLAEVEKYPSDTRFYFHSWTFGYENVWIALSSFLESPVHLDRYRWSIYKSLSAVRTTPTCTEAPPLSGFSLGNHQRDGCLTPDPNVRLHSCEKGSMCSVIVRGTNVVQIVPIVTRLKNGTEIAEAGAGGGKGDLDQTHELETGNTDEVGQLMHLCATSISDPALLSTVLKVLSATIAESKDRIALHPSTADGDSCEDTTLLDKLPLKDLVPILAKNAARRVSPTPPSSSTYQNGLPFRENDLPRTIKFPYSRHSSYGELCELVQAFSPRDIYPCTVDSANWTPGLSIRSLFGHLCSGDVFVHDAEMLALLGDRAEELQTNKRSRGANDEETQTSAETDTQAKSVEIFQASVESKLEQPSFSITPPKLKRKLRTPLRPRPSFNTSVIEETRIDSPSETYLNFSRPSNQGSMNKRLNSGGMDALKDPTSSLALPSPERRTRNRSPRARFRLKDGEISVESIHSFQERDDGLESSQIHTDRQKEIITAHFAKRDREKRVESPGYRTNPPEGILPSTETAESDSDSPMYETPHEEPSGTCARTSFDFRISRTEPRISTTVETLRSTSRKVYTPDSHESDNRTPPTTQVRIPIIDSQQGSNPPNDHNNDEEVGSMSESNTSPSRSSSPELGSKIQRMAYDAALGRNGLSYADIELVCTRPREEEMEL